MGVQRNMVEVFHARKSYGQANILRGLSMRVPSGVIYGLLGPSGCGKTTLLSCIIGHKFLDSGTIFLGVNKKKYIGYMPQEVALFKEFYVHEIFYFYGRIFGMDPSKVKVRIKQLSKILELPHKRRIIGSLSGGQQRRVSLAVTLLHDPDLLILDEPTVGLDPILCHNVWQYLLQLSNVEKKTIIITTHYIEEARHSHLIGLLREGVLLIEETPGMLMASQNSSSLEEVFLNLSKKQQYQRDFDDDYMENNNKLELRSKPSTKMTHDGVFRFHRFYAQLARNVKWTYRNLPMLLFMMMLPIVQTTLYSSAFGKEPIGLPIALVSAELPTVELCESLLSNVTYNSHLDCDIPVSLTCQYYRRLSSKTNIISFSNVEEAKKAVSKNLAWGVLYINDNFTNALLERISDGLHTSELSLDQSVISVWIDMTDYIIAQLLRNHITESLVEFLKDVFGICGLNPELGNLPIKFNPSIHGVRDSAGFRYSGLPGFMCAFIFYMPVTFTSGAIMMDKSSGIMDRSMISGMTKLEIVLAHLVVQFVIGTAQSAIMMFISYVIYAQTIVGSLELAVLVLYCVMFLGISFGFFLAELLPHDTLVSYASIGTILTIFFISGIIWPREGSHWLIRFWSGTFPVVSAIDSYTGVTIRGYDLTHFTVYYGIITTLGWCFVFSFLSYVIYKMYSK